MKTLERILSSDVMHALGWALVHSIWQGLAIALLLMLLLVVWKPRSVHFKYMLYVAGLCAMLTCMGFTFAHTYLKLETIPGDILRSDPISFQALLSEPIALGNNETVQSLDLSTKIWSMLQSNMGLITLVWLLGAIIFSFRLFGGLFYAKKMLRQGTQVVSNEWRQKLQDLAERLHIRKSVRLMTSALADSPMVIGHFKPVILFPISMISGLSMPQIEAVLAHELAHIKRNDWLVNLMQSLAETLFFFHPAAWWLSSKIREEREKCCDDMAVQITGDAFAYVKTLSAIQAVNKSPALTLAFGKKKYLLERVKRLISSDQEEKTFSTKLMLLFIMILSVTAFAFIFKYDKTKAEDLDTLQSGIIAPGMAMDALNPVKDLSNRQDILPKNKNQKNETENSKEKEEIASGWEDEKTINKFFYAFEGPEAGALPKMDSLLHSLQTDSLLADLGGLPFIYEFHSFNNGNMGFEAFTPLFPDIPDFDFQFPFQDGDTLILDSLSSALSDSSFRAIKEELQKARRLSQEVREKYMEQMQEYQEQIKEHQEALQALQGAYQQEMHKYREEFREKLEDRREHLHELRKGKLEEMRAEQIKRQRHLQALHEERREKMRAEHKAQKMQFEAFHEELRSVLTEDELIKEDEGIDFSYNADKDEIKVNGKKLNKKQREKYKELLESHGNLPESGKFRYQNKP